MGKTLKQFVFEKLEENGCVLDQDVYNFLGREPNFYTIQQYKGEFYSFHYAKKYFENFEEDKTTKIGKGNRMYYITNEEMEKDNRIIKIPKIYYNYLKDKGVKTI